MSFEVSRTLRMLVALLLAWSLSALRGSGQDLQVTFGAHGLERLAFQEQVLEDLTRWPADGFHIWHMKCFDSAGKVLTTGQYGWGETNQGRSWDAASRAWTYSFVWGTIRVAYLQRGDSLDIRVTESNRAGSGIVLDGASIVPLTLHLPGKQAQAPTLGDGVQAPGVTLVSWGADEVAVVAPDERKPLYSGVQPGKEGAFEVLISGTRPDSLAPSLVAVSRPVAPGQTDSFTVSLRFAGSGSPLSQLASDAYKSWVERWPVTLRWNDRRAIGTVFLASSSPGDKTKPTGFPGNPRRYFTDAGLEVRDAAVLERFQRRVLEQAKTIVANLKRMNAQGAITWDIEGEEYPQDTSYVCAPDQIAQISPEMETVVGSGGQYAGMKLDDAYFKIIRDAGFRVGVCVRPQKFVLAADGSAQQMFLPDAEVAAELSRKMRYAHDRWGATIFYVDSTVRRDGSTLDASVIEAAAAAVPDSLVIPEESTPRMFRSSSPFQTFLFHGDLGTSSTIREYYPNAFSANLVNDVDAKKLAAHHRELVEAVRGGDILMVLAGFWQENDAAVVEIYHEASKK